METLPGASATRVLQRHHELLAQWLHRQGARPLQIESQDASLLFAYGLGCYQRANLGTHVWAELLWLASPYADHPLQPAPGRPWDPATWPNSDDKAVDASLVGCAGAW